MSEGKKEVWLKSIQRDFGWDTAVYETRAVEPTEEIIVSVSWALLHPFCTVVCVNGQEAAKFTDTEGYIQPHVALTELGYVVHGVVDFAMNVVS